VESPVDNNCRLTDNIAGGDQAGEDMSSTLPLGDYDNLAMDGFDSVFAPPVDRLEPIEVPVEFSQAAKDFAPAPDNSAEQAEHASRIAVSINGGELTATDLTYLLESLRGVIRREVAPRSERAREVEELRDVIIEAKDTIIKLLTDRVNDRAQIARLETELKFLPELQSQTDRAIATMSDTSGLKEALIDMKSEMSKSRLTMMRGRLAGSRRKTWWDRFRDRIIDKHGSL